MWTKRVSDEARRIDLMAQIIDLEPQMLRVLGPAQARDWVDVELTMSQLKMMFVLSTAMSPGADRGRVTRRKAVREDAYRSLAASISPSSTRSRLA